MRGPRSVLDDLGEEVTGIVAPVSLCMALTVALTVVLNPNGESDSHAIFLSSAYYSEQEGDSAGTKLSGAIINALVFVGVVAAMTFALVLLFKHGCVRVIYAYMGLAGFSIFFVLAGLIAVQLLHLWHVHLDDISFLLYLFNFAAVGSLTLFFFPAPLLMKQGYLIVTGVVTAYVFSYVPPWTTWVLLVAMAVYDVAAVLVPGGPLKMLVELAQEREETIPALVYEARPVRRAGSQLRQEVGHMTATLAAEHAVADEGQQGEFPARMSAVVPQPPPPIPDSHGASSSRVHRESADNSPREMEAVADTQALLGPVLSDDDDGDPFSLPNSIKLGLGDFIFYSLCLSRAAFSGWAAAFGVYLAILAGLGCMLLWLATAHRALPALPISITMAVLCFVLMKCVMEAVVLPASLALVYF